MTAKRTPVSIETGRPAAARGIFCNRTLNLRSIAAIGYDMDYTLVHYNVNEWERQAYDHLLRKVLDQGWPVADLAFDPAAVVRGLIIDTELGNVVKANRFGYVKQAMHGTKPLDFEMQRKLYGREIIELSEPRWLFLNTLFSLSQACLYMQLVDRLDEGNLPAVLNYRDLHDVLQASADATHMEGELKQRIMDDPDRFVEPDPELPLALLDQRAAGKKLLLITNSEWEYTRAMMNYAFDPYLDDGMGWSDLFDVVIVSARKPAFFSSENPFFEVATEDGLLRPVIGGPIPGQILLGGNAAAVEEYLGVSGDQVLYVGDHMFSDVKVTKSVLRWRTALIVREIEHDIAASEEFADRQRRLAALMGEKEELELEQSQARLMQQRKRGKYGPAPTASVRELERRIGALRSRLKALDEQIGPLAEAAGTIRDSRWGPLMRAGNDKSHMARQIERSADVYLSRVSNFLRYTPFSYFRSPRGSLPHDIGIPAMRPPEPTPTAEDEPAAPPPRRRRGAGARRP